MKTWTPDTADPVADWHRGQLNDQAALFRTLHGHDLLTKALGTRQTPLTSTGYLRLLGKSRSEIAHLQALTAPPVKPSSESWSFQADGLRPTATKAKAALGKGAIAGGATTYAPGFSPNELAAVLAKARAGDPDAQAVWRAYAQTDPDAAGALIKQANATVTKGKRKPKPGFVQPKPKSNRGRVTSGTADDLADQAASWERQLGTPQPAPPVSKRASDYLVSVDYQRYLAAIGAPESVRAAAQDATTRLAVPAVTKSAPAADPALVHYARAGNPAARALLLEGAH